MPANDVDLSSRFERVRILSGSETTGVVPDRAYDAQLAAVDGRGDERDTATEFLN
jgi:hypothetical protein